MKAFEIGLGAMMLRYYLMMMIVVAAGFLGQWWLAFFAVPVFLSTILGIKFEKKPKIETKIKTLKTKEEAAKKAM